MGEKKLREYLTFKEFQEEFVNWSHDTFVRRVKQAGFPATKDDGGTWLIKRSDAELWFKRRKVNG